MEAALDWTSGIAWTLVYIVAIYIGISKKTYCIPAACICLNFNWEALVVLVRVIQRSPLNSGFISQILWLVLDIGVLFTWILHNGSRTWKKTVLFIGSAILMAISTLVFGLWAEAAFTINLIMSMAFLFRLDKQMYSSMLIAILKCIGTLPATILNGLLYDNTLILAIGGLCLIADVYYLFELLQRKTTLKEEIG